MIYRSIVEIEDGELLHVAPEIFMAWARRKVKQPTLEVPVDGQPVEVSREFEVTAVQAAQDATAVYRAQLYENRSTEEIKTTFTVLQGEGETWFWLDLERWADDAWGGSWTPYAPGLVNTVLDGQHCARDGLDLPAEPTSIEGQVGETLARAVRDEKRTLPVVVLAPSISELRESSEKPYERAAEIQRRVAGIAPVFVLGEGAVAAFSRGMLRAGEDMDVRPGAVRAFLPGTGGEADRQSRHRFVPFSKVDGRRREAAALIVAPPLLRAACHQSPPALWASLRKLPEFSGGKLDDASLDELIENAGETEARALADAKEAHRIASESQEQLDDAREELDELLSKLEDAERRADYANAQLRERNVEMVEPPDDQFVPDFCEEVCDEVARKFDRLEMGPRVREGAEQLDAHVKPSWARKALRTFQALQAYAAAKAEGFEGNFRQFCDTGQSSVIPTSWLALQESETTDNNARFRSLRTFEVPSDVASAEEIYMPAHVKLEQGGDPAPRIFFHDDTGGATGSIHVGWFGPHPDNKSKS